MTPDARLLAIEHDWEMGSLENKDTQWLINRVKRLTEALEFYSDPRFYRPDGAVDVQPDLINEGKFTWKIDTGQIARKALENE